MEKTLTLTETEVNQIIKYLAEKPYGEVYQLIGMLNAKWLEQTAQAETHERSK